MYKYVGGEGGCVVRTHTNSERGINTRKIRARLETNEVNNNRAEERRKLLKKKRPVLSDTLKLKKV